jgi:hypothetical protein
MYLAYDISHKQVQTAHLVSANLTETLISDAKQSDSGQSYQRVDDVEKLALVPCITGEPRRRR